MYFKFSLMFSINFVSIQNYSNITISSSKWWPRLQLQLIIMCSLQHRTVFIFIQSTWNLNYWPMHAFTMSSYEDEELHTFTGWFTCVYEHNFSLSNVQIQSNRYQLIRRTKKHLALRWDSSAFVQIFTPSIILWGPTYFSYKHNATIAHIWHIMQHIIYYMLSEHWIKHCLHI